MAKDFIIVLNKDEDSLSVIDIQSQQVIKTVKTDFNPHEIVVSKDGNKSYISCSLGNVINVLDHASWSIVKRITHPLFDFPHGLGVAGDGSIYLAATYSSVVFKIDPVLDEVVSYVETGQKHAHMIAFHPDGQRFYVPNIGANSITYFDHQTMEHFAVGRGPEGIAVHPDGNTVYVANQEDDELWVLDTTSHKRLHRRLIGKCPIRVVFTPDGSYALIPNRESGDLSVIATAYHLNGEIKPWEIKRIPVGSWPGGTVVDPVGAFVYVANNKTNDISVISLATLKETHRIDVGIHPDGMAYVVGK